MLKTPILICAVALLTAPTFGTPSEQPSLPKHLKEKAAAAASSPSGPTSISVQEMLVSGPPQLKMHSLAMISQTKTPGHVDESYLPGLKTCANDKSVPIRSITARLLGQHFIEDKDAPHQEAIDLLIKLAKDESSDVRYSAVYHGLSQLKNKPFEIVKLLIDFAATNRKEGLATRIAQSLEDRQEMVVKILDEHLAAGSNIAFYEIYEDLTGKPPAKADQYLDQPSSRPRMFIFKGQGADSEACKIEFENALKSAGITNPSLHVSGSGENYVLLLKTYLTKDYKIIEKEFSDHPRFTIAQDMWLTPEKEIQIEMMMRNAQP